MLRTNWKQLSGDVGLGIPFNIASYSLLVHIIANECGLEVGDFVHTIGDAHIYSNHVEAIKEYLSREPFEAPTLVFDEEGNYKLEGYQSHPAIKAPVAV